MHRGTGSSRPRCMHAPNTLGGQQLQRFPPTTMGPRLYLSGFTLYAAISLTALALGHAPGGDQKAAIRRVHAKFTGKPGTFAQFGDSITVTQAYWSPLRGERKNAPPEMERAFRLVNQALRPECWAEWKGPQYGSEGGQTAQWANEHVVEWLHRLNPEVALIMFGSNDLRDTA